MPRLRLILVVLVHVTEVAGRVTVVSRQLTIRRPRHTCCISSTSLLAVHGSLARCLVVSMLANSCLLGQTAALRAQ